MAKLHGSWLQPDWDMSHFTLSGGADIHGLYYGTALRKQDKDKSPRESSTEVPVPTNSVLFQLGVALIELSLGKSIEDMAMPRPQGTHVSRESIALGLLNRVYYESGINYGDAVRNCLSSRLSGPSSSNDAVFMDQLLDSVISPVLEDWAHFEKLP